MGDNEDIFAAVLVLFLVLLLCHFGMPQEAIWIP
jgi:hypothetical protein